MAVCNIFNKLNKLTGNFLTFSQYSEDLTKGATQYEAYRVVPSKFIVMNIDYEKVKDKLYSYDINENIDLNRDIPKYFQDYFENGCAFLKKNYKGDWTPKQASNMFWNTLYKADMLTTTTEDNSNYFINEVRYIGDINIQSYDEKAGEGYNEIYCYIPSEAKAYKYGTIDLRPDESVCDCTPYTLNEVDNRIQYINPYTIDYEPWTAENDESLEDYKDDPQMWHQNVDASACGCSAYEDQEIKNALNSEIIEEDNIISEDNIECNCESESNEAVEDRIDNLNPYTAVSLADDWKYLADYVEDSTIWDNPQAVLDSLFEEIDDYEILSEQTNSLIKNYYNTNDYLEGFEGNEEYSIKDYNDILKIYYADNSLLDKSWIDNRPRIDGDYQESYEFNTIIILYEIHKTNKKGEWIVDSNYSNIPLGIYFTGKFNEDLTLTNPVTKYIDNDEIYKEGTAYGLRICHKFTVTPINVSIKSVNITQENDNYSAFCQVMSEMSKTQQMMNNIISSVINQTQYLKDTLSMFKNNTVNTPYLKEINGNNYWFVKGKLIGPATVTQTTPIYIDNTTIFPETPIIEDIDITEKQDNPIKFAPVNDYNLTVNNQGFINNESDDLIIEIDYGDVKVINQPVILTDWITDIEEIKDFNDD